MRNVSERTRHQPDLDEIRHAADVLQFAGQRIVPGDLVVTVCEIVVKGDFEADVGKGLAGNILLDESGDPIADFDVVGDLLVFRDLGIVLVAKEPFISGVGSTGFEDAKDFRVDTFEGGGVTGCFDGVDAVKGIVGEGHFHEISLDESYVLRQTALGSIVRSSLNTTRQFLRSIEAYW